DSGGGQDVGYINNGNWLRYDNVDFGSTPATQFKARVASGAPAGVSGLVQARLDSPTGQVLGEFAVANTGGWQSWRTVPANMSAV
ncbi:carbohydrate-binding protein, partial [Micromonospora aurantiaca]|nr:carbohydrate-binding protein [Micromonospora aurantiaca]